VKEIYGTKHFLKSKDVNTYNKKKMIRPSTAMCNSQAQIQIYADRFPLNHSCVKDNNKEKIQQQPVI